MVVGCLCCGAACRYDKAAGFKMMTCAACGGTFSAASAYLKAKARAIRVRGDLTPPFETPEVLERREDEDGQGEVSPYRTMHGFH